MRWIQRWHVGQLIVAWIAAAFMLLLIMTWSASVGDQRRELLTLREDIDAGRPIRSHARFEALGLPLASPRSEAAATDGTGYAAYIAWGEQTIHRIDDLRDAHLARQLWYRNVGIALVLGVLAVTWIWFGGRQRHPGG